MAPGARPAGSSSWNPLLDLHQRDGGDPDTRDDAIARYGFAVPTGAALTALVDAAPGGIVELGAGTGYWSRLLADRGLDVVAYDRFPAPSPANRWFAGSEPWYEVAAGDAGSVAAHPARTLLLVWPTRDESWAADAVELFRRAGGTRLAYVGEGPGGRSGDDRFHALLGTLGRCQPCAHGVTGAPCTCDTPRLWQRRRVVDLARWTGYRDRLEVYTATTGAAPWSPWWRRRRRRPHR